MKRSTMVLLCAFALQACSADDSVAASGAPGRDATGAANAAGERELAAVGLRNFSAPFPEIACSGQPTEEQFDELAAAGVTRVIHLRQANENGTGWEEERAAKAGVRFERLEIAGADGLSRENVERFAALLEKDGDGTTLVSCGSSNRVGALFALKAHWLDGKSVDEALAIGERCGMTRLRAKVEELLKP